MDSQKTTITISASREEIWGWKAAAVRERKTLSEWVRGRLVMKIDNFGKPLDKNPLKQEDAKIIKQEKPETRKGIDVPIAVPANTVEEVGERLKEMEARKQAEELKRLTEAGKAMEKRYGKG